MKRSQFLLGVLCLIILALCSCTHTLYTHQQVLQQCHTKEDVFAEMGQPDEINPGIGLEQWTYNMDKQHLKKSKRLNDFKAMPDTLVKDSVQLAKPGKYARYVKFMFDDKGTVVGYKSDGVDLTTNKRDSFGKSLVNITGAALVVSALIAFELYKDGAFDN
ncbi:MAG: hypothetical protein JSU01_03360 [Bacteroidetes bacterium]|nr:hypothetical protein [Bacteroidota bacterium]